MKLSKLAAFDMAARLSREGRRLFALADRFGASDEVKFIQSRRLMSGYEQTKVIAR